MAKAIRNLLPRCYHQNGLLGPFSAGEHTGRGRMQTRSPRLDLSHSFMSHVRLDIFPLHPPNLPWLSLLTQSSFHFGQLQVMPPDRETTPTFPPLPNKSISGLPPLVVPHERTPHDSRVAPSAPASSHKVPGSTTYSRLQQELMWAWSGYITPRAVSS